MTAHTPLGTPAAMKEQITSGFGAVADRYDSGGTEFFGRLGELLVSRAGMAAGDRVLDLGCGKGAVTLPAARAAGPDGHVIGLDLAAPMLAHARECARDAGLANITFRTGDAEDPLPFEPGSFDVILAGNLVPFLPRPGHAARKWRRLLAPGGMVGFSWGTGPDPRWVPVIAAVDAHVPGGIPGFEAFPRRPPFTSIASVEAVLTRSGYGHVATDTHDVTMTYQSPEQWWDTYQSQGPWAVSWRHIPAADLPAARADAFAALEHIRDPGGTLTRTLTFACTTGECLSVEQGTR